MLLYNIIVFQVNPKVRAITATYEEMNVEAKGQGLEDRRPSDGVKILHYSVTRRTSSSVSSSCLSSSFLSSH